MVITRLAGGLGNQMFHYAIARNFLKSDSEAVYLDTFYLQDEEKDVDKIIQRPFALQIFNNLKAKVDDKKLTNLLRNESLINKFRRSYFYKHCTVIEQKLMEKIDLPTKQAVKSNVLLVGNFQSELYFHSLRKELLFDFKFPDLKGQNFDFENQIISAQNSVSIHVRRGDYWSSSNKGIFTSVNINYYNRAIEVLLNKLGVIKLNAFVFTDDTVWAKEVFTSNDKVAYQYVEGNTSKNSWMDMALMATCTHHIIANSSFSWWGAWLSVKEGITIAPKHWFLPNTYQYDINNIVPGSWVIVDYDHN